MSAPYIYNPEQERWVRELIYRISDEKIEPVVRINSEIFQDCYLEDGMLARLKRAVLSEHSMTDRPGERDTIYEFTLDFSEFVVFNKMMESANYWDKTTGKYTATASDVGLVPRNYTEEVFHSITHGKIFFEVDESTTKLVDAYVKSEHNGGYVSWLEKLVLDNKLVNNEHNEQEIVQ